MSGSSFVAGVLAYAFATFAGGFSWHMIAFFESYKSLKVWTNYDDPIIAFGVAAISLQGLLFSYMLPLYQSATGSSGLVSGARFGLWVGGVIFSIAVLAHSAKNTVACVEGFALLEGVYCLLQFPLSLAAVALAQRRASRRTTASTGTLRKAR